MKNIFSLAFALLVVGCVPLTQQSNAMPQKQAADFADQKWKQETEQCTEGQPKATPENAVRRRDCLDNAMLTYMKAMNYPFMGIALQRFAAQKRAAIAFENKQISFNEYDAAIQQITADFVQKQEQQQAAYLQKQEAYQRQLASKPTMDDVAQAIYLDAQSRLAPGGYRPVTPEDVAAHRMNPSIPLPFGPPSPAAVHTDCYNFGYDVQCDTQ